MANELPLKIRVDIRDLWNAPKCPLQQAIGGVTATLGHKIVPEVQWPILWGTLKGSFADPATFIPGVVMYTVAWYEQLNWRLDNEAYSDWTEHLLSILSKTATGTDIVLQIEAHGSTKAGALQTHWDAALKFFRLYIPHTTPKHSQISSSLSHEFDNLFGSGKAKSQNTKGLIDEEGWADIDEEPEIPSAKPGPPTGGARPTVKKETNIPRTLPTITSLGRPSDLFQSTSPYLLIVETGNPMLVQCSHQKSLELLAQYLQKWGKPNRNDGQKRNVFAVDLIESDFAVGLVDSLRIEPNITFGRSGFINPTIVLAFVEGVLGYKFLHASGNRFVYRSDEVVQ